MKFAKIYIFFVIAGVSLVASAENIATMPCGTCGNSSLDRAHKTLNFLRLFNGGYQAGNGWKVGETVIVNGGDGTSGKYMKYSSNSDLQYGCVANCGPGDQYEGFLPLQGGGGGGEYGGIGGGGDQFAGCYTSVEQSTGCTSTDGGPPYCTTETWTQLNCS